MNKKEMIKEVIIQIIAAALIQVLLYGVAYVWSYFNKEKLNITVCTSTQIDNAYTTSINIKNYQNDKSVKSIIMWSNANIDSSVLNYKDIEIKDKQIIIKNIPPSYDGTIVVHSKEKINEDNTKFETEEKRTVNFLYAQKEEITSYWKQLIINIIVYIVIYTIMAIIFNIFTNKQITLYKQEVEQIKRSDEKLEKEYQSIEKELEESRKKIKEQTKSWLRVKIYLHRKLVDYAKELNFYRELIKRIVNKDKNKNDICYEITKELRTFKTLEKINLEDLEIDALKLSDIERDEINNNIEDEKDMD